MNSNDIYVKTPLGEEAMTQRTRVVQRSQRMILVLVDGKTRVGELGTKIGDSRLAETALKELEAGGFIALADTPAASMSVPPAALPMATPSQLSQFSTFGPKPVRQTAATANAETVMPSNFSTFGRPALPKGQKPKAEPQTPAPMRAPVEEAPADLYRPPRRPLPLGKVIAGSVVGLVLAGVAGLFLYPYDNQKGALEAELSQQLGTPVRIGAMGPGFAPEPVLELKQVRLGPAGEGQIDTLQLPGLFSHLTGGSIDPLAPVTLKGGHVDLALLAGWLGKPTPGAPQKLKWQQMQLMLGSRVVAEVNGEVLRTGSGQLQRASLATADRSFKLEMEPQGQDLGVTLDAASWKPQPEFPVVVDYFSGKGQLRQDKLVLSSADVRLLDGRYEGELLVDWGQGQGLAGSGVLHRINLGNLVAATGSQAKVSGELSGTLRFRAQGNTPEALLGSLEADGEWRIERGELRGVDLADAVRRGKGQVVRGGSTRFERLSTVARLGASGLQLSGVQVEAGLMRAEGRADVSRASELRGRMQVSLSRGNMGSGGVVLLEGNFPNLEASIQ